MKRIYVIDMLKSLVISFSAGFIGFLLSVFYFRTTATPVESLYLFSRKYFKVCLLLILIFNFFDDYNRRMWYWGDNFQALISDDDPWGRFTFMGIVYFAIGTICCKVVLDYGLYSEIVFLFWPMFSLRLTGALWILSQPLVLLNPACIFEKPDKKTE